MSHNALDFHSAHGRTSISNISKYYRNILIKFSSRDKENHPVLPYWGSDPHQQSRGSIDRTQRKLDCKKLHLYFINL